MTPRSAFVSIFARERLPKKLSRALCCSPEGVHALGPRNLVMPQLHVLPFLVSWFYSPSPLILSPDTPPGLPMTCSATKHSEIVDSSFSEYAFWLDTQIQRPFSLYHTQRLKKSMSLEIEAFLQKKKKITNLENQELDLICRRYCSPHFLYDPMKSFLYNQLYLCDGKVFLTIHHQTPKQLMFKACVLGRWQSQVLF